MNFEYVKHDVLGCEITFVLDGDNHDWYMETMRKRPFKNPVHHHLTQVVQAAGAEVDVKYADFGANIGVTSYFAAAKGVNTLAVEAGRKNFLLLEEGEQVNGFGPSYRKVFMAAAGEKGSLHFAENSAWGAISAAKEGTYSVECDTIANILLANDFADAQILKVDIEGAELNAMAGFEMIVERGDAPDIIMESNEPACVRNGYSCQELWSRLRALGYDVYEFLGTTLIPLAEEAAQDALVADVLATRRSAQDLSEALNYKIVPYDHNVALERLEALLAQAPEKPGVQGFVARQKAHIERVHG